MMQIRLADTSKQEVADAITWLQSQTFSADEHLDVKSGYWWIARDGDIPIAFAAMQEVPSWERTVYMARCGVLRKYRGNGLQKKFLMRREKLAKDLGFIRIITTTYNNPPSANSLISRGFKTYTPQSKWGAKDTIYWLKEIV